jgi:hypothetical protein
MLRRLAIGGEPDVDSPFAALPPEEGSREAERFDTLTPFLAHSRLPP